jgi:hypothetical protein
MAQTKKVEQDCWIEYLSMFSNGNRGRRIAIEVTDLATGDQQLTDAVPLFAIDYDPAKKGDDLMITTATDDIDYSHKIIAPVEIWESKDDNGMVVALEVIDRDGAHTIVVFKS